MSRVFQDENLLKWEAYASGGAHGYSDHARIVFHCLSDRSRRARVVQLEGDQSEAERRVAEAGDADLSALLAEAVELD